MPLGEAHSFKDAPTVTEWRFEDVRGTSPFDKIGLHHVAVGKDLAGESRAGDALSARHQHERHCRARRRQAFARALPRHSRGGFLGDGLSHALHSAGDAIRAGLTELKGWTYDLFASDIDEAVKFIRAHTRHGKIFLVGFSRGVTNEYLYTALHPENVQGIIALDGFISKRAPKGEPPADIYGDDIGGAHLTYDKRKTLMEMVIANPDGPAPIPKYKTARENLEHVVRDAGGVFGGHGGLANPPAKSDAVELAKLLITYDRYWPTVQDFENPFTPERLATLEKSQGAGDRVREHQHRARMAREGRAIGAFDRRRCQGRSFTKLDGAGHLDVLCGNDSETIVFAPSLAFIKQHQK